MTAAIESTTPSAVIDRVSLVLDAFDGPGRLTLAQVVRRTGLPRSSAHRMLERLVQLRWLRRSGRDYELGMRLVELGSLAVHQDRLHRAATPLLHDLHRATGLVVHLAVLDASDVVYLEKIGDRMAAAIPTRVGGRQPAHCAAVGKAMLAALEAGEVDLAIGYFPDLTKSWFFQQRLLSHHFTCLLRADHPIEGAELTLEQFLQLEHAVVRSEGRSQEIFERFLKTRGIVRKVELHTPHFLSIPHLIAQSDMVVTVPHAVGVVYGTPSHRLKVMRPPFASPTIELKQHWHRRFHRDPRSVWIRAIVSELFNERTDEW